MKQLSLVLLVALASLACAQNDQECPGESEPVLISFKSFIVSEVTTDTGVEEHFIETNSARPGQVIEYRVFATNVCEVTLPAGGVSILGPIPSQTTFVANSATVSSEKIQTQFTCEACLGFHDPPVVVSRDEAPVLVDPTEYTAIRWTLLVPFEPSTQFSFFYRVTLN
jgi:uncharacterized repeat protein (TIGR01451 family)